MLTSHYVSMMYRPNPEMAPGIVFSELVGKLHQALAELAESSVGISFPGYSLAPVGLGYELRLHGPEERLGALMAHPWQRGVRDHLIVSDVLPVPEDVQGHRIVKRRQFKVNLDRDRRRWCRRHGKGWEEALQALPDSVADVPNLPYVRLQSRTNGQHFVLNIETQPLSSVATTEGGFNRYGLSAGASVPWF
ncbi:type I-F CRISPR-associated endoribonuclease Cas6/Csy4 [Halomonas cerina]|uniref:CRISPR-associated endonuclease Csy4 n=1 Tax=Halomonas cerina TaxID=447424 RepID=A0A839VC03_9GAMM|nr:type I-F CRISPR-associated endoribonuclease Cas6/Csy4 [Halomonas cerina]MBB3190929.1 CRISPR-associated endonuclease Csy4 [Halomonas cerina]